MSTKNNKPATDVSMPAYIGTALPSGKSLVIVIPTRNRPHLALAAVQSVIPQLPQGAQIWVSDNSTTEELRTTLKEALSGIPSVVYIRPPEPLPMSAHWNYALEEALASSASHFMVLTDRMVFRTGDLPKVWELQLAKPSSVISYYHDQIDDSEVPVRYRAHLATKRFIEVPSNRLLELSARMVFHGALPRLLNSSVPRELLLRLQARFGCIVESIAPDVCFAYRVLGLEESIWYFDDSPLLHYAISRSNGASYIRGTSSPDYDLFTADRRRTGQPLAVPFPELETLHNIAVHEYNFAASQVDEIRFPPVDLDAYILILAQDIEMMNTNSFRSAMEERFFERTGRRSAEVVAHSPSKPGQSRLARILTSWPTKVAWAWASRYGVTPRNTDQFRFRNTASALRFAQRVRPVTSDLTLWVARLDQSLLDLRRRKRQVKDLIFKSHKALELGRKGNLRLFFRAEVKLTGFRKALDRLR